MRHPNFIWAKDLNNLFAEDVHKITFNVICLQGKPKPYFTPTRTVTTKKAASSDEDVNNLELSFAADGKTKGCSYFGRVWHFSKTLNLN